MQEENTQRGRRGAMEAMQALILMQQLLLLQAAARPRASEEEAKTRIK